MAMTMLLAWSSGATATRLKESVVAGGGGTGAAGGQRVELTIGQTVVGQTGTDTLRVSLGYWAGVSSMVSTAIPEEAPLLVPGSFSWKPAVPNPTRGSARIVVVLPRRSSVGLAIMDVTGRMIRMPAAQEFEAGAHVLTWDGLDGLGGTAAPGVYFLRLLVDGAVAGQQRLILVR